MYSRFNYLSLITYFFFIGQNEMLAELNSLPFSRDSLRIRQKREDLEKQLKKIEEGITILSKPKVFIRVNE